MIVTLTSWSNAASAKAALLGVAAAFGGMLISQLPRTLAEPPVAVTEPPGAATADPTTPDASSKGTAIQFQSTYLFEPFNGARIVRIRGLTPAKPDSPGAEIQLDTNSCSLDALGEPAECTLKGIPWRKISLTGISAVPNGKCRAFDIGGLPDLRLRLALEDRHDRLLVIDDNGKVSRVIPLQPARP